MTNKKTVTAVGAAVGIAVLASSDGVREKLKDNLPEFKLFNQSQKDVDWYKIDEKHNKANEFIQVVKNSDVMNSDFSEEKLKRVLRPSKDRDTFLYSDGKFKCALTLGVKPNGTGYIVHGIFSGEYDKDKAFKVFWKQVREYFDSRKVERFYTVRKVNYDDTKVSEVHNHAINRVWEIDRIEKTSDGFEKIYFYRDPNRKGEDNLWVGKNV